MTARGATWGGASWCSKEKSRLPQQCTSPCALRAQLLTVPALSSNDSLEIGPSPPGASPLVAPPHDTHSAAATKPQDTFISKAYTTFVQPPTALDAEIKPAAPW